MNWYGEGKEKADQIIYESFFKDQKGIMIEVGCADPTYLSMSKGFRERGWRTIGIDPNPIWIEKHKEEGLEAYQYAINHIPQKEQTFYICNEDPMAYSSLGIRYSMGKNHTLSEIKAEVITLDSLLEKLNIEHIDFLAVDTEGWEIDVIRSFNTQKYAPSVIQLECINDHTRYNDYMNSIGYSLWKNIAVNSIYTKK